MPPSDTVIDEPGSVVAAPRPRFFYLQWLQEIDQDRLSWSLGRHEATRRLLVTLVFATLCLFLVEYLKHGVFLQASLELLQGWGLSLEAQRAILMSPYTPLIYQFWWTFWIFIGSVALPLLFIRYVLKESFADHGLGWGDTSSHKRAYMLLGVVMVIGTVISSFASHFTDYYPMYGEAGRSWLDYIAWEFVIYLPQFIWVEFFFRGFLLRALQPAIGAGAILVMVVPYTMIHFPKPMFESVVALGFGLVAGALAMRSRSIWGGVIIHVVIAFSMDTMALLNTNRIPVSFWP